MTKRTLAALALATTTLIAQAGPLTGQTLGAAGGFRPITPGSALVGAGVEFTEPNIAVPNFPNDLLFDFDEQGLVKVSFVIDINSSLNHTGVDRIVFSDLNGTIARIIGFDLVSVSNVTGIEQADLSFTDDSVTMSLGSGSRWASSGFITAQMRFADAAPVPEPGVLGLAGIGLLAAAVARRRARAA